MDAVICDELLQEIFQLLPASSFPAVSLVSRRWLALLRSSTSSLSLHLSAASTPSFSSLLSHYPFLSALTVAAALPDRDGGFSDELLLAVAAAPCASRLSALRFLPDAAVSPAALLAASASLAHLTCLQLTAVRPLSFRWLALFRCLKSFSLVNSLSATAATTTDDADDELAGICGVVDEFPPLEKLSLCGIRANDRGLAWLWRHCRNLKSLQLRACDGTGDGPASLSFACCLAGLLALELRSCRAVADRVLLLAADHCRALSSLLVYDGGGREALYRFIHQRGAALNTLDLRLPLDLHNDHLLAIAAEWSRHGRERGRSLAALRLQSCCLVTGDGLRSLARASAGAAIEELALVSCDVVEREPGLLIFLSQSMRQLRRLDLSYNETLCDKEVGAMLASCQNLVDIRLRGCTCLTGAFLLPLLRHCSRSLEVVDISRCSGIAVADVEIFAQKASRLNHMIIEESKVSEEMKVLAWQKGIKFG